MIELETRLSAQVLNAVDCGVFILDTAGRVVAWNDWMVSATGVAAEKAKGEVLADLFPGADFRRFAVALADAFEAGSSSILTHNLHPQLFPLRTRAGRTLVHDVSVRPVGERPFTRCLVQVTDVTVAVERERVLRARQNARYSAVVDSAPDAILTIDVDGVIQTANAAAGREFGYDPAAMVGMPAVELFQDKTAWLDMWRSALCADEPARFAELTARRKTGEISHLEASAAPWQSEQRTFVTAILRDVNARHAAETALRRLHETLEERFAVALSERKILADIVENNDALIQVIDHNFRLMAINKASADEVERLFGARPQPGNNILDPIRDRPEEAAAIKALWDRALSGQRFTVVRTVNDARGERRCYEFKFNPLSNAAGERIGAFQFVYDVTDRIENEDQLARTQEALRQSQKMEAIGQLTGGIAHDFNNLLTGIIGSMDILRRRITAGKYEDTQRFMDAATTSANRAAALTHRLLAFARRQPLDPKPTRVNKLVRGIEDLLERTLGERVRTTTDLAEDLWPTRTDANQLENALINLAINARDAMPDGGRLNIATRNESVDVALRVGEDIIQPGDYVVISVSDTGQGIAPDVIGKVFEPFYTTKPLGEGTGLGLSMIYGFVKQTRGHIRLESELGRGTIVSLYLPRHLGEIDGGEGREGRPAPKGEGETVLLVEDDPSVRLLIGEVLRDLGYACIEAHNGQTASPVLTSNARLDLMITDVGLPGMNGRDLARLARTHRPDLKILFVTGYAEHVTGGEELLEPGTALVTKPFTLDALGFKIREMLAAPRTSA
jgi:PAS domain S-box-containing protein